MVGKVGTYCCRLVFFCLDWFICRVYTHPHSLLRQPCLTVGSEAGMQKRRSIRETKNMIQTALWLPRAMHEQLKKTGGDRGLGDEIRRRLQASFDEEQVDATTHELLDAIEQIERNLSLDEPWHTDRFTF